MDLQNQLARMALLPSKPGKAVDGRAISQKHIDAVLAYNPAVRKAVVKLNPVNAHGQENGPALAMIDRVYAEGDWIFADITPTNGNAEQIASLAGKNGPYAFRSIEMDDLELNGQKQLYLEAVALCGAERPAVANLPPAEFSKQSKQVFTINTNGGQDMPENETVTATEPIDLVKYKEDLEAQFAKKIAEKESEWAKREETEIAARMEAELKLRKEKVTQWVNSKAILTKVRADQRENCIALAMKLHGTSEKVTFGKKEMGLSDAFTAFVESLPDFISPKEVAAYLPKDIINADVLPEDPGEQDKFLLNKINAYAAEKGIELKTPEDFTKVEGIVKKQFQGVK